MTQQSFGVRTERFQIASEDRFVPAFIRVTSSASVTTAYCSVRPVQLRNPDITYGLFRRQLKGHLFREA